MDLVEERSSETVKIHVDKLTPKCCLIDVTQCSYLARVAKVFRPSFLPSLQGRWMPLVSVNCAITMVEETVNWINNEVLRTVSGRTSTGLKSSIGVWCRLGQRVFETP